MTIAAVVFLGFIIDRILGDPHYRFHSVRIMGGFISAGEKIFSKIRFAYSGKTGHGKMIEFISGAILSVLLIAASYTFPFVLLFFLYKLHFFVGLAAEIIFCYQIFAAKALKDESMKVYSELEKGDIVKARLYLSYIVGRDTHNLNEEEISKAAVETVAENLSDAVIAPMVYLFIGGVPLGFAYKAVNTLDSMIGYNNEKYAYFGKFAARFDDAVNFLPSRISALIMIFASFICGMNGKQAWKTFKRDRYNHKSPNSAQTESVCAGALGLSLSGDNLYGGVWVKKPTIGNAFKQADKEDIKLANRLMYAMSWLALFTGVLIKLIIYFYKT